jgi:adenine-specific DNA-methyltransferase
MAKRDKTAKSQKRPIEQYAHKGKTRTNNPPVGLVTPETDPVAPAHKTYDYTHPVPSIRLAKELDYDSHLDPQLVWAQKKEHTSFEVPTVSLHVHERVDPRTIIDAVRRRNGDGQPAQGALFETKEENPPLREAIDFYRHAHNWSNRLIAGDSLLVMNSLLEKEGMAGQFQMVYIDPPYGIEYGSNFQPFVNQRMVKDRRDEDLSQEPETIKAFRDTWELGIHSYLTYLRDRLFLMHDLLHESGSCFVQIGEKNLHMARALLDEVFGRNNFVGLITMQTKIPLRRKYLAGVSDYILWYGKDFDGEKTRFRRLFVGQSLIDSPQFSLVEQKDGTVRPLTYEERMNPSLLSKDARVFTSLDLTSSGRTESCVFDYEWRGRTYASSAGKSWKTNRDGMEALAKANRLYATKNALRYKLFFEDYPVKELTNLWTDTVGVAGKTYVVQTDMKAIARCLLMSTDPGDLVFDPTCGSGTTAYVAEQWGRRWITCDTSRVSITLARQRLITSLYDYYELAHPEEGVGSGFRYRKVPHVTLGSIAQNEPPGEETLYDQPFVDNRTARVSGPFTIEAVPAPNVKSIDDFDLGPSKRTEKQQTLSDFHHAATPLLDASIARSGPTIRQSDWRDELLKTGLRGKGGQMINFSRVEPLGGTRWLHADAETKGTKPERVVISFGPEYAPLEQRQVEMAWEEARTLHPKPEILVFAAFQFDPEAAKDIDELTKEKTGMIFLTAQMNADMLTEDLKKKRSSNQSFWLVGRPDVELKRLGKGEDKGKWQAEVRGFDYYNTRTGAIESGDTSKIAMWLLDTDYDGRSLYPRQVFFPMADIDEGWSRLARNLKAEIDPELIEAYGGTVSLPFEPGEHKRVAVKVIDDRGIESLKIVEVK